MRASLSLRFTGRTLELLDQTALPDAEVWRDASAPEALEEAIRALRVRGAPAIGVAAALCLGGLAARGEGTEALRAAAARLRAVRPTAVNLMWATDRMVAAIDRGGDVLAEALAIFDEDVAACAAMAEHGAALLADGDEVLTHCNTGGLATAGVGTALGVIRRAWEGGRRVHVWVDETRPLLQGARLTAWELGKLGIPYTLVTDGMAGAVMRAGRVTRALVGADRIARNGDFANKVGTYTVAVLAAHHGVPLYVAAPWSTVDLGCPDGAAIPIEERPAEEVRGVVGPVRARWAPADAPVFNPAFDVTPGALVRSFVTERGVFAPGALASGPTGDGVRT